MGRRKIETKKIENLSRRQVAFSQRRKVLFEKAQELSILCGAEVAVIVFSNTVTDKLYEFSSTSMERTLQRYGRRNIDLNKEAEQQPNDQSPAAAQDVEVDTTIVHEKKARREIKAARKHVDEIDDKRKSELDKEILDTSSQLGLSSPIYKKKRSFRMRVSNQ